jgi:3-deoxy-D-manno-octulosonate 8-phosphate phosphatase KdsC-like HAD superfamily phosphatase
MKIYIVTKLDDNGDGATNSIIAVEKSFNVAQKKMKEDVKELLEEYDLNEENVAYYGDKEVEISNFDEDVNNYVYASYEIEIWDV